MNRKFKSFVKMKASLLNKNIFKNSYPVLFQVVVVYIVKFYIVCNSHGSTLDFSRLHTWKFHKILRVSCESNAGNVFYACVCVYPGWRQVQVRLVEPVSHSLNSGDCFLLVTPSNCFLWTGKLSNTIEREKVPSVHTETE